MQHFVCRDGHGRICRREMFIRWQMPCGIYYCADGREVLFDRNYAPICERIPGMLPRMANPCEWVDKVRQEWFYSDDAKTAASKKRRIAEAKLVEWGMLEPVMEEINELLRISRLMRSASIGGVRVITLPCANRITTEWERISEEA
jgi:hypothetical protein